ncbi:hypothetical protein BM536_030570 [Streptomyces phaeoluteigriseus]|nr:hypothetical protein [Streptomyces phaeoluteigriseus]OQD52520.1 hypothetical protein BM536_030570 [Streptomyces phaeoluteigriseus]
MPAGFDGCDHSYGTISQCVPWTFPKKLNTVAERCDWLAENGYGTALKVSGRDRHGLDRVKDGIACGKGDVTKKRS